MRTFAWYFFTAMMCLNCNPLAAQFYDPLEEFLSGEDGTGFDEPITAEPVPESTAATIAPIETEQKAKLTLQQIVLAPITANYRGAKLSEITAKLAPPGWLVDIQVKEPATLHALIDFTAETTRYQAFYDLLTPLHLKAYFYPNMLNEDDKPEPLIVIAKERL